MQVTYLSCEDPLEQEIAIHSSIFAWKIPWTYETEGLQSVGSRRVTLMAECEEELKSFLRRVKEESEDAGLTLNIQKTKIMAFGPNASWQIEEEKVETDSCAPKSLWMVTAALKLKDAYFLEEKL